MSSSSKPSKTTDPKDSPVADKSKEPQKQALSLEEDDEFEDFPVEGELQRVWLGLRGCELIRDAVCGGENNRLEG